MLGNMAILSMHDTLRYCSLLQRLTSVPAIRVRTAALVETLSTSSSVSVLTRTQALTVKLVREGILTTFYSSSLAFPIICGRQNA